MHAEVRPTPTPPGCSCFRLCSEGDARSFHLRLPTLVDGAAARPSPWMPYLRWVYGAGAVPLPLDLQRLELFYLALLPVEWRCNNRSQPLPPCAERDCAAWLRPTEPSAAELALHERLWSLRSFQWHRSRLPKLLFNHTLRFLPRKPRSALYRATRVEVTRRSAYFYMPNRHGPVGWDGRCAKGWGRNASDYVGDPRLGAAEGVGCAPLHVQARAACDRACTYGVSISCARAQHMDACLNVRGVACAS